MRLASFMRGVNHSWGRIEGKQIVDLGGLSPTQGETGYRDLGDVLRRGELELLLERENEAERIPTAEVVFALPVRTPQKILGIDANYLPTTDSRAASASGAADEWPLLFSRFVDSLVADGADIVSPRNSIQLDYHGELAVVIGRALRHASPEDAEASLLGYTIANGGTVRDHQRGSGDTTSRNFPASGALGPVIVTPDEFGALTGKSIRTRLNGMLVQESRIDRMRIDPIELICFCSRFTGLRPGDIILCGTPVGTGADRSPPLWMFPGDHCEVEIDGIGTLHNRVAEED